MSRSKHVTLTALVGLAAFALAMTAMPPPERALAQSATGGDVELSADAGTPAQVASSNEVATATPDSKAEPEPLIDVKAISQVAAGLAKISFFLLLSLVVWVAILEILLRLIARIHERLGTKGSKTAIAYFSTFAASLGAFLSAGQRLTPGLVLGAAIAAIVPSGAVATLKNAKKQEEPGVLQPMAE